MIEVEVTVSTGIILLLSTMNGSIQQVEIYLEKFVPQKIYFEKNLP